MVRPTTLFAEVLNRYMNDTFVETGTADGSGVQLALDLGFETVYSIELNPKLQDQNRERFAGHPEVNLITGDSVIEFSKIVGMLNSPATFWLDAHNERHGAKGFLNCPLEEELKDINRSAIKTHTILIDDVRMFGKKAWGKDISEDHLKQLLKDINPDYTIKYEDSLMARNDVMVAHIESV